MELASPYGSCKKRAVALVDRARFPTSTRFRGLLKEKKDFVY